MPLGYLKSFIIKCAEYLYKQGTTVSTIYNTEYPYLGPIFSFRDNIDSNAPLELIDNSECYSPTVSCLPPDHYEPQKNQVNGAFRIFQYYEGKIINANKNESMEGADKKKLEIITSHLAPKAVKMLAAIARSYEFTYVNSRDEHGDNARIIVNRINGTKTGLNLHIDWSNGILSVIDDAPPEIQLAAERFNSHLAYLKSKVGYEKGITDKTRDALLFAEFERLREENKKTNENLKRIAFDRLSEGQAILDAVNGSPAAKVSEESEPEKTEKKRRRPQIVRSIMATPKDFRNRDKVVELAEKLDKANIPLPRRTIGKVSKWEPKTYTEVAQKPNTAEYKRIFDHSKGALKRDLYNR